MLSVPLGEAELADYLNEGLSVAALNRPDASVLSGTVQQIEAVRKQLERQKQHKDHWIEGRMHELLGEDNFEWLNWGNIVGPPRGGAPGVGPGQGDRRPPPLDHPDR